MLRRLFKGCLLALTALAGALAVVIIVGITADVVGRNLFNFTVRGMDEASEYMLYLICILPAPLLVWRRGHIRIDLLVGLLPPRAGRWAEIVLDLASAGLCVALAALSLSLVLATARAGTMVFKSFIFPEWWLFAPMPVVAALMAAGFAAHGYARWRAGPVPGAAS